MGNPMRAFPSGQGSRGQRLATWAALIVLPFLAACSSAPGNRLEAVQQEGELRVITYVSATTYYDSPEGPAGFEYDLAKEFANELGVGLRMVVADRFSDVLPRLLAGEADFAAAGLGDTETRRAFLRFTPAYQETRQQVVYRLGNPRPARVADLVRREIEVHAGTSYIERLNELKQAHPDLKWIESRDKQTEDLLQMVWEGLLDLTIADSNIVAVNSQFFPELQIAFSLPGSERLAWAFPRSDDASLYDAAVKFLEARRQSGLLAQLIERYYGAASRSNFINLTVYRLRIQNRLPLYQKLLKDSARRHGLDWRLLAALAYQESYWDPGVVSPTGVRGFMMLTRDTAGQLGVKNREDVAESINGGARYFRQMLDRIPARVTGPDRLWFALAAYNMGLYHLEDARILTQRQKGDPDKWNDVKERLPLLADPKWYTTVKYGYARGIEPVRYVNRVRTYYDVLVKIDEEERAGLTTQALKLKAPAI